MEMVFYTTSGALQSGQPFTYLNVVTVYVHTPTRTYLPHFLSDFVFFNYITLFPAPHFIQRTVVSPGHHSSICQDRREGRLSRLDLHYRSTKPVLDSTAVTTVACITPGDLSRKGPKMLGTRRFFLGIHF